MNDSTFSISKAGKTLNSSSYTIDIDTKRFITLENDILLDFREEDGWHFETGDNCVFITGDNCSFVVGDNCKLKTGSNCFFKIGENVSCTCHDNCTILAGKNGVFECLDNCAFIVSSNSVLFTGNNCFYSRNDVDDVGTIPVWTRVKTNALKQTGISETTFN